MAPEQRPLEKSYIMVLSFDGKWGRRWSILFFWEEDRLIGQGLVEINDNVIFIIACDRTHEWRATSPRARNLRNSRKSNLYRNFSIRLGARHERACHSLNYISEYANWSHYLNEIAECTDLLEIASHDGNGSLGRSATEMAEGRFGTRKEKSGEAREVSKNKAHN